MKLRTPGKFRHTFANSGNPDVMSRLIRIFTACLVDYFYSDNYFMNQTRSLSEFS